MCQLGWCAQETRYRGKGRALAAQGKEGKGVRLEGRKGERGGDSTCTDWALHLQGFICFPKARFVGEILGGSQ